MNPPPLTWTKATFHVPIRPPEESKLVPFPVAGIVSGPFGIFRGDTNQPDRGLTQPRFSLVLLVSSLFRGSLAAPPFLLPGPSLRFLATSSGERVLESKAEGGQGDTDA